MIKRQSRKINKQKLLTLKSFLVFDLKFIITLPAIYHKNEQRKKKWNKEGKCKHKSKKFYYYCPKCM